MQGIGFIQDLAVILVVAGIMGWLCQRIGLSVVVGYLVAGIIVGPYTPPFSLVNDAGRIETLAQVGLVFLMFSIGLKLSLRKMRRLGFSMLLAVFLGAAIIFYLTRLGCVLVGIPGVQGFFIAAMLMVSSSSIIGKVLQETGQTHENWAQRAMGVTVLEDVVAVVMLTLLSSMAHLSGTHDESLGTTLGLFGAFVVLAGVLGLLLVPWLMRRLSISADEELQTVGTAAMLFGFAILADRSGYSLALGAFLLGTIVSETPHRTQVERTFEGMRDIFTAVFFVAIGLQIDVRLLGHSWLLILGVALFTLVARTAAVSLGLTLMGTRAREAMRTGLAVTPIGEFSFIIVQLGVMAKVLPSKMYPIAVGVSLVTTLIAPFLIKNSGRIVDRVAGFRPKWLGAWSVSYQSWLDRLQARQKRNLLWQLSRKRFIQIGIEMLFVTGLLVSSDALRDLAEKWLGRDWLFPNGLTWIFWFAILLVILGPLVAIWRNMSALSLLFAQVSVSGHAHAARLAPIVESTFKIAGAAMFVIWLPPLLPTQAGLKWLLLASVAVSLLALLFLRRKLTLWHSELEIGLQDVFQGNAAAGPDPGAAWLHRHRGWNLSVIDCVLPDLADCQGRRIAELDLRARFGCMIAGIGRQGYMISLPTPDTVLYPRDHLLLIGTAEQVNAGKKFLMAVAKAPAMRSEFDDVRMDVVAVPEGSQAVGKTLLVLSPAQVHRVQLAGIRRGEDRMLNPGGSEQILDGDELLVIGAPEAIRDFKDWISEKSSDTLAG